MPDDEVKVEDLDTAHMMSILEERRRHPDARMSTRRFAMLLVDLIDTSTAATVTQLSATTLMVQVGRDVFKLKIERAGVEDA